MQGFLFLPYETRFQPPFCYFVQLSCYSYFLQKG